MRIKILFRIIIVTFLISLLISIEENLLAQTATPDSSKKSFRLFEDETLIEISLRFDLSTYFRTKPQKEYLKTRMTIHLSKTDSLSQRRKTKDTWYIPQQVLHVRSN